MSCRELAKSLIDQIPEGKLLYVVADLQGVVAPDETPNAETPEDMGGCRKGVDIVTMRWYYQEKTVEVWIWRIKKSNARIAAVRMWCSIEKTEPEDKDACAGTNERNSRRNG